MHKRIQHKNPANPDTAAFVAGKAKPGNINRKMKAKLESRQMDYIAFNAKSGGSLSQGVSKRRDGGGFHRPGSYK